MTSGADPLDAPIWGALTGRHAALGRVARGPDGVAAAVRYDPEVAPFAAVRDAHDPAGWEALASLTDPRELVVVMLAADVPDAVRPWPPAGWRAVADIPGAQMVGGPGMACRADDELVDLGPDDVPEMLDLVARTRPGPFEKRTVELGGYRGRRVDGRLVAMAGRRFAPSGATEISAVCTDESQRGRGLAARLVGAVATGILAADEVPFLHVAATNTVAAGLYAKLGMRPRRRVRFVALRRS